MILPLFVLTFIVSIVAYRTALFLFPVMGLLDFPERYGLTRARLPYPTGIIAVLLFLAIGLPIIAQQNDTQALIIGIVIIMLAITSCIDDRSTLPIAMRLGIQMMVALLLFWSGAQIFTITHPFGGIINLDQVTLTMPHIGNIAIFSLFFTLCWLLFTMNAFNWADGISGQISMLSTSGFAIIALLGAMRTHQENVTLLSVVLCSIALATACIEGKRSPTMILGDTGSMFFGLMLGLLAIYQGGKVATTFITFGIPLADAIVVIIKRMSQGQSPLQGGRDHLHHQLLQKGIRPDVIALWSGCISLCSGFIALFLSTQGKCIQAGVIFLAVAGVHWWTRGRE